MLVSYLTKTNIDVYRIKGQEIKKIASGNRDSIKPFKEWGKKVLIIGRDVLLHTRKRYPPTTAENIAKAIKMDIKDIFPLKDPAFSFRILEQTTTYTLVNIWAWDRSNEKEIGKVFPFTHILPEDAAFASEEPEITVFEDRGFQHLIAHSKDGFLGGLSLRVLTDKGFEAFLRSLGKYAHEIKRVRHYTNGTKLDFPGDLPVVYEDQKWPPPYLKNFQRLNLKDFKNSQEIPFNLSIELFARIIIYCLAAYSISLFVTKKNYEYAIENTLVKIRDMTNTLSEEAQSVNTFSHSDIHSDVINSLQKKRETRVDTLTIMNILAKSMPEGSYIRKFILNENNLELSLSSETPLDVIKTLSRANYIKSVKLKGAPTKKRGNNKLYSFRLTMELNPCN